MTDFSKMSIDNLKRGIELDEIGIKNGRGLLEAFQRDTPTEGLSKAAEGVLGVIAILEKELAELKVELASRHR